MYLCMPPSWPEVYFLKLCSLISRFSRVNNEGFTYRIQRKNLVLDTISFLSYVFSIFFYVLNIDISKEKNKRPFSNCIELCCPIV